MLLAAAPTPTHAARLTHTQLVAVLRRAGRVRLLDAEATRLQQILRADYLHQPVSVEHAMGRHATALLQILNAACRNAKDLAEATVALFGSGAHCVIMGSACLALSDRFTPEDHPNVILTCCCRISGQWSSRP